MEKIQILGEIVDNRSFVKMPTKGRRNRTNKNRNKNKQKNLMKNFNYAEQVPTEIWVKIFSFCDQVSLDNLKMTCVIFYNIIDSNATNYGILLIFG